LLHAAGQVRGFPDGRVIHVEVAPDGADDDLTRVEADADLHLDFVGSAELLGVAADGGLHAERRIARAHRVVLVGQGRAEERHDPVAHHLVHRAFVAVDGLHHPLEDGVEELARLLRITVGEQLHRALEVGEEDGDLLALAFQSGLGGEDFLGQVLGGVMLGAYLKKVHRKRRYGHSRDKRADCVQVVIALIVTPEGFPLAYDVLPGNTADKTTLRMFLQTIETQYRKAERVWVMDRGSRFLAARSTRRLRSPLNMALDNTVRAPAPALVMSEKARSKSAGPRASTNFSRTPSARAATSAPFSISFSVRS
jgi:hypothetical protein